MAVAAALPEGSMLLGVPLATLIPLAVLSGLGAQIGRGTCGGVLPAIPSGGQVRCLPLKAVGWLFRTVAP